MNETLYKPRIESHKEFINYFKHITTLDTGAILLMVAFIERAFEAPEYKILAVMAFGCFIISLICSVLTMYRFAHLIWYEEENRMLPPESKFNKILRAISYLISRYAFIVGMILLAIFGALNILESGYSAPR